MIGGAFNQLLNQLIGQFGQQNVQSAMTNTQANGIFDGIKDAICQSGLSDFAKNIMNDAVNQAQSEYQSQETTPACQNAVDDAFGDEARTQGREIGENLINSIMSDCDDEKSKAANGSGSWLVALAKGMAKIAGDHLGKMIQAQQDMEKSSEGAGSDQDKANDFTEAQAVFQAESKLFSMAIEATSTALKAVGDGLA
jgi:hypothetical protein